MPRVLVITIFTMMVILNFYTTDLTSRLSSTKQIIAENFSNQFIPDFYMITPTYTRVTQQSDLTNIIQSAVLSDLNIQLIIVEDTDNKHPSAVVQDLAHQFSFPKTRTNITLLQCASSTKKWNKRMRGVGQRNAALEWVSKHQKNESAMVYFGDDDNTYSYKLFHEFVTVGRDDDKESLGVLPVGMIQREESTNFTVECKDRRVINFHAAWLPGRLFAMDMAGFAFKVKALLDTEARFGQWMGLGQLETQYVCLVLGMKHCETLIQNPSDKDIFGQNTNHIVHGWKKVPEQVKSRVVALAQDCQINYVWHTKTEIPKW